MFEIYTPEGVATGEACPRDEVHRLGLWHLTVHLWLRCGDQVLIQKRSSTKETHPELWDISCAGHVDFGEAPREAALRELKEELGIEAPTPTLVPLGILRRDTHHKHLTDREWTCVYLQNWEEKPACRPDPSEVAAVQWLPWRDFRQALTLEPGRYVPHEEEYRLVVRILEGAASPFSP